MNRLSALMVWGLMAAPIGIAMAFGLVTLPESTSGTAYVTEAGANPYENESYFGDNWDSVRTFRLNTPLKAPLKVYVDTRSSLYKPYFRDYVTQSLSAWSRAIDGRLSYVFTNQKNNADITVDWVSSFGDKYIAGITTYSVGHARMEIRALGVPEKDIKANIIHEFGHALGIAGHSPYGDDIMVGTRRWKRGDVSYEPTLSRRDIQAIRLLYSNQWRKGEDLYSANAQTARLIAGSSTTPSHTKPMLQPAQPQDEQTASGSGNFLALQDEPRKYSKRVAPEPAESASNKGPMRSSRNRLTRVIPFR